MKIAKNSLLVSFKWLGKQRNVLKKEEGLVITLKDDIKSEVAKEGSSRNTELRICLLSIDVYFFNSTA